MTNCDTDKRPFKRLISIDLDGVLNEYKGEYDSKNIPILKKGAKEFLKRLNKDYDLVLFTSRNLLASAKWLIENNIDKYFKDITNIKNAFAILLTFERVMSFFAVNNLKKEVLKNLNLTLNNMKTYLTGILSVTQRAEKA